jgi:hypothetical protein
MWLHSAGRHCQLYISCLKYELKEDAEEQEIQGGVMDSAMTQQYR